MSGPSPLPLLLLLLEQVLLLLLHLRLGGEQSVTNGVLEHTPRQKGLAHALAEHQDLSKFPKVSALVYQLYEATMGLTFENV